MKENITKTRISPQTCERYRMYKPLIALEPLKSLGFIQ